MMVPESIRSVPRPTNTVVVDSGHNGALRYAVRERAGVKYGRSGRAADRVKSNSSNLWESFIQYREFPNLSHLKKRTRLVMDTDEHSDQLFDEKSSEIDKPITEIDFVNDCGTGVLMTRVRQRRSRTITKA